MTDTNDLNKPAICIPRVFSNVTETKIREVFVKLALGDVSRIDIKDRHNEKGEDFKRVYVHFKKWNSSENAQEVRNKLLDGKDVKVVYDFPWFWKMSASKWETNKHTKKKANE